MLTLNDIHTYYGESHVLRGVSLHVPERSVVALLGRNGMGKSTTVHSIIGFVPPRRGEIVFDGKNVRGKTPYEIAHAGIALVPQGRRIFPSLSVQENLTMAARKTNGSDAWTLPQVYELFPILKTRAQVRGTALSGGEQQMLSLARALMTNPRLILMDEPSEGLAPLMVRELQRILRELHARGLSILLVEQNLQLALAVADTIFILNKGEVAHHCTPRELRADHALQEKYLGAAA